MDKKTFLVIDPSGQYVSQANALANKGKNKVFYSVDSERAFPLLQDAAPGKAFEYLEDVPHLWDALIELKDEIDCVANFDSANQDIISALKEHPDFKDKSLFGASLGARIEEDREGFKKIQKKLGMDVGPYHIAHGIDEVEELNKKHGHVFVKVDKFRGTLETKELKDYEEELAKGTFDKLRCKFGPVFKDRQKLIVEEAIEFMSEFGMDVFVNKHGVAPKAVSGIEYAKGPYLGRVGELSKPMQFTIDKLMPLLKALDYRGCFSTEHLLTKDGKNHLIDPCPRGALPLTVGYKKWIKNLDEVVFKIGLNEKVDVDIPFKYLLAIPLCSKDNKEEDTLVKIEKGHEDFIEYGNAYTDDKGRYYVVKGMEVVATIVLAGNDWHKLLEQAKDEMKYVEFQGKEDTEISIVDEFPDLVKKAQDLGIDF